MNARAISLRRQPADEVQRQRDLRVGCECRMAAREDQLESLVRQGRLLVVGELLGARQQLGLAHQGALAADPVDGAVARCGDEPAGRVVRGPVAGPSLEGRRERVLERVLGEVEVAEDADQSGQDARALVPDDLLESFYAATSASRMTTGRTSMWPRRADGIFAAHSIASSIVATSTR